MNLGETGSTQWTNLIKLPEQELLERIVFESEIEHFGGEAAINTADVEPRSKTPEFVATAALFVVLMALGIRNIRASAPVTPAVLQAETEVEAPPKTWVTVKMADASASANIRQEPTVESKKIGKAKDGDSFELVSENSGWYEIKLADDAHGFMSTEYAVKGGTD